MLCLHAHLYSISCLLCTNCTDIVLSFDRARQLPPQCDGIVVESAACQTIIRINYLTKEIHLQLTHSQDSKRNAELKLLVESKFTEPKTLGVNVTHTCKTADDCAKLFYQSTTPTLISRETVLNQLRDELFDPAISNVQQCIDNREQSTTCQNAFGCHGYEIIENSIPHYEGECINASSLTTRLYPHLSITLVQGDPTSTEDWNHLGYTCNKRNECNARQHIRQMVRLANDFYPWEYIGINAGIELRGAKHFLLVLVALLYLFN